MDELVSTTEQNVEVTAAEATEESTSNMEHKREGTKLWENLFFIISVVASIVMMYVQSRSASQEAEKPFAEVIAGVDVKYLLICLGLVLLMIVFDSFKYNVIIRTTTGKSNYPVSLKVSLMGKFYDNITPFSSGGQPFQIYYLHQKGYSGGRCSAIILFKYSVNIALRLIISAALMLFNARSLWVLQDPTQQTFYQVAGWIGFAINFVLAFGIVAFAIFPKITQRLVKWGMKATNKLKHKKVHGTTKRSQAVAEDFRKTFAQMIKKPINLLLMLLYCLIELALSTVLPYYVVLALCGDAVTPGWALMLDIATLNVFSQLGTSFVPTPGTSGAVENLFMLTLTHIATGVLFWTVFSWRFLSYYSFIVIGLFMSIEKFIRQHRQRKALQNLQ